MQSFDLIASVNMIDGGVVHRNPRWAQTDRTGSRFVRPTGYNGAPTAEVVRAGRFLIASSWIMQPPRAMLLPSTRDFDDAIRLLEAAEAEGQKSANWVPLPDLPASAAGSSCESCTPYFEEGKARRWAGIENGRPVAYFEVTGSQSGEKYLAIVEGVLLTARNGEPLLFDALWEARCAAEKETR